MSEPLTAALPRSILESRKWRQLRPTARAVLIEIALAYDGANNGAIRLSVADAIYLTRTSVGTVQRALKELGAAGLITNTARGQRFGAKWRLNYLALDAAGAAPTLKAA
jgi:DNA-binding IclR family transcriptional regulator